MFPLNIVLIQSVKEVVLTVSSLAFQFFSSSELQFTNQMPMCVKEEGENSQ